MVGGKHGEGGQEEGEDLKRTERRYENRRHVHDAVSLRAIAIMSKCLISKLSTHESKVRYLHG